MPCMTLENTENLCDGEVFKCHIRLWKTLEKLCLVCCTSIWVRSHNLTHIIPRQWPKNKQTNAMRTLHKQVQPSSCTCVLRMTCNP